MNARTAALSMSFSSATRIFRVESDVTTLGREVSNIDLSTTGELFHAIRTRPCNSAHVAQRPDGFNGG